MLCHERREISLTVLLINCYDITDEFRAKEV